MRGETRLTDQERAELAALREELKMQNTAIATEVPKGAKSV